MEESDGMRIRTTLNTTLYLLIMIIGLFMVPTIPILGLGGDAYNQANVDQSDPDLNRDNFPNQVLQSLADIEPGLPSEYDIGLVLQDRINDYKTIFEPWKTKAAIHAVAYHEPTGFLALGGGYLYDNEIHIWRLNSVTNMFDKVWDSGDSIIRSDVMAVAWGDTDLNNFIEVVAASSDGFVYVFEQRHIYDPQANTENMFDHVWTSPYTFRAFDVAVYDADRDYRADIIVGSWDGKVRCFEYVDHSGYPFAQEHWIEYKEVWSSGDAIKGEQVYRIAYGDTNYNGLPEIIAGTRQGRVYVFENDGTHLMINGRPFPLINDNHYRLVWTSAKYTWRPILSMDVGELDQTPGEEIALVAQGQGVFILDWDDVHGTYNYRRVYRGWDSWQTDESSPWRLDFWADSIVTAHHVTFRLSNGTHINEPIEYVYLGGGLFDPPAECYPYNTGLANASDGYYSYFNADVAPSASAVIDLGKDEEGTGSASAEYDLRIRFGHTVSISNVKIAVGQSKTDFQPVSTSRMWTIANYLYVDVDDALGERRWDWFRYINLTVYGGVQYRVDSIQLSQVYTQITSALTVALGPLPTAFNLYGPPDDSDRLLISTVIGNFYAFAYNSTTDDYDLIWDSSNDDFFKIGTNVWDMVYVGHTTNIPVWLAGAVTYGAPSTSGVYNHWTVGDLYQYDWVGAMNPHEIIVLDTSNNFRVYRTHPNPWYTLAGVLSEDLVAATYFDQIKTALGTKRGTIELALFDILSMPVAVVGMFDPNIGLDDKYGVGVGLMSADLRFYHRSGPTDPFTTLNAEDASDVDATGDIVVALSNAKTVPRVKFVDWDGDNDLDMILSTGFVYYCENIGMGPGALVPTFRMVKGYFEVLNSGDSMNDYWGQPEVCDIDQDGDYDLILSYDTRKGATCWLNTGTMESPKWVENKRLFSNSRPETNLKYHEFTGIRIVPWRWNMPQDFWKEYLSSMVTLRDAQYTMMAYRTDTQRLAIFWPVYNQSASYIVATYPTVSRYEFAIQSTGALNFGYHVTESWNTADDLINWTLTIRSGDIDGDGKGEIIVGDYDNNIYIFEHMVNNTYKRAFRSFDINHTVISDTSPYRWEELEGVSGTFKRVIWDHVDQILADCDIDSDGLREMIAAAGLKVYVFEDTGIDDTYDLVFTIDLRDIGLNATAGWSRVSRITALGAGDDYDLNGNRELVIAAGPYLFIYDVGHNAWTDLNEYYMETGTLAGRYYMIGNGAEDDFIEAHIQAIALCDTDEDGLREVIIGGKVNTTQVRQDGFLKIYEWRGANFEEVWQAPPEVTTWNPVTSIILDDQDYDSKQEIIIGHTKGFDIWEYSGTSELYNKVEVVTSSPNYPIVQLESAFNVGETRILSGRGDNDLAYLYNNDNRWIMSVFCRNDLLWYKIYYRPLDVWSTPQQVIPGGYPGYQGATVYEYQPSLFLSPNGTLYLTWKTDIFHSGNWAYHLWVSRYGAGWSPPKLIGIASTRAYPSLFRLGSNLGVVYISTPSHSVFYGLTSGWSTPWTMELPLSFKNREQYYVQSSDIIMLPDGGYALAISARNSSLSKTDLDIFVATSNSSFIWTNSQMFRATTSYNNEINPDLSVLAAPENTLIVAYESVESPIEDRIQMSYSNTYTVWRQHEPLASFPQQFIRIEVPGGGVVYKYNASVTMYAPQALCPSLLGLREGGFMQMHTFSFWARVRTPLSPASITGTASPYYTLKFEESADLFYGINPSSRFTHFNIRSVIDMDVGDTDGDGRREVVVGFDDRVGVYELKHSNVGAEIMQHEEAWLSGPLPEPVTGVTVYDSNGNGYEEIGVSCERGEVFLFEYVNSAQPRVPLLHSATLWSSTLGTSSLDMKLDLFLSYDVDNDGLAELFRGESNGTIRAFDSDGHMMWSNHDSTDIPFWMSIGPATDGGDVLLAVTRYPALSGKPARLTLINAMTGITVNDQPIPNAISWPYGIVKIADVVDGPASEIIVTNALDELYVFNTTGGLLYSADIGNGPQLTNIAVGNFSGREAFDIALIHGNGSLTVLSGNNGSVIFQIDGPLGYSYQVPVVVDVNGDGRDDIVTGTTHLWIVDSMSKSIMYNSTVYPKYTIEKVFVADYDDDSLLEALVVTRHEVYLEEINTGRAIWTYQYSNGIIKDATHGVFIEGRTGIALCTNDGTVIALDALTGVVVWFVQTDRIFREVIADEFDGDPLSEIGVSEVGSGRVTVYCEVVPWTPEPPQAYELWTQYWSLEPVSLPVTICGLWTVDIDGDSVTEFVVADSRGTVYLYHPIYPTLMWAINLGGTISDVKSVDFTGDSVIDLLVLMKKSDRYVVIGVNGATGHPISGIIHYAPEDERVNVIAVGNFRASISGTEYAVVYTTATNLTYVVFYDKTGARIAVSSFNATSFYPIGAVTGQWVGDASLELGVVGITNGAEGDLWAWQGDGTVVGSFLPGLPLIVDVIVGDFDGDAWGDMAVAFADSRVLSFEVGAGIFWDVYMNATVRSLIAADFVNDARAEILVNTDESGIIVSDGKVFSVIWRYDALTTVEKRVLVTDINAVGMKDLVLMLEDHIAVIEFGTGRVLGAYVAWTSPQYIGVGNFDNHASLDLIYYYRNTVITVTDHTSPPPPMSGTSGQAIIGSIVTVAVASVVSLPFVVIALSVPMFFRARRRHC